jgi:molybdopterin converting factor small subunit
MNNQSLMFWSGRSSNAFSTGEFMITVFIPPQFRSLTSGTETVEVDAASVRQAVLQLDELFPGISVSISGRISGLGLFQKVSAGAEIHFLPAIGGG